MRTDSDETDLQRRVAILTEECQQLNQVVYEQNRLIFEHHRVTIEKSEVSRRSWPLYFGHTGKEADMISFAPSGNSQRFVQSGFSEPEDGYRWTEGGASVFRFMLPTDKVGPYRLKIRARAFQTPQLKRQRVMISVNNEPCGTLTFDELRTQKIRFSGGGNISVTLQFPDATSPALAGISADRRDLGLAIYSIAIVPGTGRSFL
jgi:hypothetical protein